MGCFVNENDSHGSKGKKHMKRQHRPSEERRPRAMQMPKQREQWQRGGPEANPAFRREVRSSGHKRGVLCQENGESEP